MKRLLDLVLVVSSAPFWIPLLGLIAVLVRIKLGKPVLFCQVRPGIHGRGFRLMKFRTMTEERDEKGNYLPNELRLTRFGGWLRAISLDELPELFNVLRGQMSLVGPRPLLMQYVSRYTPEQARRQLVKPGITGWAQINGRNTIGWEEKFKLDVWYVDNVSLWLDLKILFLTLFRVLMRQGINQTGAIGSEEFMGTASGPRDLRSTL